MQIDFKVISKSDTEMVIKIDPSQIVDGTLKIKCHGRIVFPITDPFSVKDVGEHITASVQLDKETI